MNRRCVCACVLSLAALPIAAEPLIDNMAEPTRDQTVLSVAPPLWAAQSFSSPTWFEIDSIDLLLGNAVGEPDAFAEIRVGLDPTGPVIATLTVPPVPTGALADWALFIGEPITMAPGELYWLVVGPATTGSFDWGYAFGNMWQGIGSLQNYSYSEDLGATWVDFGGDNPYQVRISGRRSCPVDLNIDGEIDFSDIEVFIGLYEAGDLSVDFNGDLEIDFSDIEAFIALYNAGC